jgi:hypothetical protein
MPVDRAKRRHLVGDGNQMLERPKWYHCETKSVAELQVPHVGLNQ